MAAIGTGAKIAGKMMAGQQLGKYFDTISDAVGAVANLGGQTALRFGTDTFAKGVAQKNLNPILRSSATSKIPKATEAVARLGVAGLGAYGLDQIFDQQSAHTQPMSGGTGDKGMDQFLMSQQLQNQKFMHDMMLVQARAESRIPGAQYGGSLLDQAMAEKQITDAGEITNREVQGIGRMIYGTGLRA